MREHLANSRRYQNLSEIIPAADDPPSRPRHFPKTFKTKITKSIRKNGVLTARSALTSAASVFPGGLQRSRRAHQFFTPDSNWTWYATEGSPGGDDFIFFG